jgi:hypothetical protein
MRITSTIITIVVLFFVGFFVTYLSAETLSNSLNSLCKLKIDNLQKFNAYAGSKGFKTYPAGKYKLETYQTRFQTVYAFRDKQSKDLDPQKYICYDKKIDTYNESMKPGALRFQKYYLRQW